MESKYYKYLQKIVNYQKGSGVVELPINGHKYVISIFKKNGLEYLPERVFPLDEQIQIKNGLNSLQSEFFILHKVIAGENKDKIQVWKIDKRNNNIHERKKNSDLKLVGKLIQSDTPINFVEYPEKYNNFKYEFSAISYNKKNNNMIFNIKNQKILNQLYDNDLKNLENIYIYIDGYQYCITKTGNKKNHLVYGPVLGSNPDKYGIYLLKYKKIYRLPIDYEDKDCEKEMQYNLRDSKNVLRLHNPFIKGFNTDVIFTDEMYNAFLTMGIKTIKITQSEDKPKCQVCKKANQNRITLPCEHFNVCDSCAINIISSSKPYPVCNKCNNAIVAFLSEDDEKGLMSCLMSYISSQSIPHVTKKIIKWILNINKYNFLIKTISHEDKLMNKIDSKINNILSLLTINPQVAEQVISILNEKNDVNNLLLLGCANKTDIKPLLENSKLFIDYIDEMGHNALFYSILNDNNENIKLLLDKGININAVDYNRDTILNKAITLDNINAITILCEHPDIIPIIKNNKGEDAIMLSKEKPFIGLVESTRGISAEKLLTTTKWKGVTQEYIKDLFDEKGYLDDANTDVSALGENRFYKVSENKSPCPSCLNPVERISDCNHIQHDCQTDYIYSDAYNGKGGPIPYWNIQLHSKPDHGYIGNNRCHLCVVCGVTYGGITDGGEHMPPYEYPYQRIQHDYYRCSYKLNIKYYRIYKIIQKFIELQSNTEISYKDAMDQITLAGANIKISEIDNNDLTRVINDINTRKTFLPENYKDIFPTKSMIDLYPPNPDFVTKKVPNMRNIIDVLKNKLTPSIITYPKKKDATGTETEDYESPANSIIGLDDDHVEKYIKFRHRQSVAPHEIKIHPFNISKDSEDKTHISIDTFISYFENIISNERDTHFGKCPFNTTIPPLCKSYLYPDELGIFVTNEIITNDQYVKYRNIFSKANLFIEYSPLVNNYFMNIPQPIVGNGVDLPPAQLVAPEEDDEEDEARRAEHFALLAEQAEQAEQEGGSNNYIINKISNLLKDEEN